MEITTRFSFLKLYHSIKGIGRPCKPDEVDENWLDQKAPKKLKEKMTALNKWCDKVGIQKSKVKYPVMFGQGDSAFPGILATEDIGPCEPFVRVPSEVLISTAVAYRCQELKHVYYENPEVFGYHTSMGDDNLLDAYLLYQLSIGERSPHYH